MSSKLPIIPLALPLPFPSPDSVNAYLIDDDPLTLVDPGLKSSLSLERLEQGLAAHGIDLSSIKRILLTHGHHDHFGAAGELQRRSGAEVLIHEEDLPKLAPAGEAEGELYLANTGIPREILGGLGRAGQMLDRYCDPIEEVGVFDSGGIVEFAHFSLQVLHLPGHSAGHTAFFWPERALLLSGDLVLPEITTNPLAEYTMTPAGVKRTLSLAQMLDSLEQLAELKIELIYPGHGASIEEPLPLIDSRLAFYRQRLEEIHALLKSTGPRNPYELALAHFGGRLKGLDIILAVNEILVNLDLLVDQGRASEEQVEGTALFEVR